MLKIPPPIFEHLRGKSGNLALEAPYVGKPRVFPKVAKIPPRIFGHLSGNLGNLRTIMSIMRILI
jgi:hypothetical protein